ncbi:hypothetical protein H6H03_14740 [Nostoc paludosum FACHB-159]|uniref:Topoisomerase 6 subunit A/Spo11 TOPRIM domain-containing protein n=2 Tax=Nostoc TaxID=1177 RepID=A0ABR8KAG9_9NOSO|nr:hypothetical protein [Nostoc sp. FACHB-857]MBD2735132.1 hypothetical protein [Nostoc paludosum FACHB-159]
MKCIKCGTDNKLKDRTANQGQCVKCNHPFAFEPTSMSKVKITDPLFAKILSDISANNTLFFTPKQLFYFLNMRLGGKSFSSGLNLFLGYLTLSGFIGFWSVNITGGNQEIVALLLFIFNAVYIFKIFQDSDSSKLSLKSRRANARALQIIGIIILGGGISASILIIGSFYAFTLSVLMGMVSIYLGTQQLQNSGLSTQEFLFSQNEFENWVNRWRQINGLIVKILPSPREDNTLATFNPDVTAYSFDRLIVCDRATIAQLLIANNFHFENNCAILSITGYPQGIFETMMQMLRRNPDLKVYALHDCSPQGIGLVHHLRTSPKWFKDSNIIIIDIGLTPRQIIAAKRGMFIQSSPESAQAAKKLTGEIRQNLSAEEIEFLESGKFVELESFTPHRLIQILQKGIAGSQNIESADSGLFLAGDRGNDIYVVQSFG